MKQWLTTQLAKALGISREVLAFFLPIFVSVISGCLRDLLPQALQIVTRLAENRELGNAEKRGAAVAELADFAKREGISCGVSVLNFAVEAAVAKLKSVSK